jgi:diguanylate cyclase (GGDEF)-like protein
MWRIINQFLINKSHPFIMTIGTVMVLLLGVTEIRIGREISFSIFYLIPIIMVGWYGGRASGMAMAVLTAAVWYYADLAAGHTYSSRAIAVWNAVMRLGILLVSTFFIAENRRLFDAEQGLARTDSLTQVANSRYLLEILERELKRSVRTDKPISLVYLDIDNFKQVNDRLGHSAGNRLLVTVARSLAHHVRDIDFVGRLGGDEFALVLPETDEQDARGVIERVQEQLRTVMAMGQWPVSFSFGVMTCYHGICDVEELVRQADALMYRSKSNGKDRVTYDIIGQKAGPHQ